MDDELFFLNHMGFYRQVCTKAKTMVRLKGDQAKKIRRVTKYDMFWFKTTLKQRFETLEKELGEHFCSRL